MLERKDNNSVVSNLETTEKAADIGESNSTDLLCDFDKLNREEQTAFVAWFSGGNSQVTQYATRPESVFFGKAECEWVSFTKFWLDKLPKLGWITVNEVEKFIAKGMVGEPEAIKYVISPTEKGRAVVDAYWVAKA